MYLFIYNYYWALTILFNQMVSRYNGPMQLPPLIAAWLSIATWYDILLLVYVLVRVRGSPSAQNAYHTIISELIS